MKKNLNLIAIMFVLFCTSCRVFYHAERLKDDGQIEVVFVQVNDVYEIAPLRGGKEGGMARVATIKKEAKGKNINTYMVMAGDFVSPSVYNSLKYEGESIRGKQMIEAMNVAGMDYVVFGNHEFDIKENELQSRIDESHFTWIASNTFHKTSAGVQAFRRNSTPFDPSFPETTILNVVDEDGTKAKIGIIGLTLPFNQADYVSYADPIETAIKLFHQLEDSVDVVLAVTHLSLEDDMKLAKALPRLGMIMGGHEHDMKFEKVGNVPIFKAHANAKSAYVNTLKINKKTGKTRIDSELTYLDESVLEDQTTAAIVEKWVDIANENYGSLGFDAHDIVLATGEPLEGREDSIRTRSTNLSELVICGIQAAAPLSDIVLVNAGAIRIDDVLLPPISQYDVLRTMPFGGRIREVEMKGRLLKQILTVGRENVGKGGYLLHNDNVSISETSWALDDSPIESDEVYRVALLEFLLSGMEMNLGFLKENHPDIVRVYPAETVVTHPLSDIRLAVVHYLKSMY